MPNPYFYEARNIKRPDGEVIRANDHVSLFAQLMEYHKVLKEQNPSWEYPSVFLVMQLSEDGKLLLDRFILEAMTDEVNRGFDDASKYRGLPTPEDLKNQS